MGASPRERLLSFVIDLYERNDAGQLIRLDDKGYIARDTTILWGKRGGMSLAERTQARQLFADLERAGAWLFRFDRERRQWHVNLAQYPSADTAIDAIDDIPTSIA